MENIKMNFNTKMSFENMIAIGILLITVAISYGALDTKLKVVQKTVDLKANKELFEYKMTVMMNDIAEIKETLKQIKGEINGLRK